MIKAKVSAYSKIAPVHELYVRAKTPQELFRDALMLMGCGYYLVRDNLSKEMADAMFEDFFEEEEFREIVYDLLKALEGMSRDVEEMGDEEEEGQGSEPCLKDLFDQMDGDTAKMFKNISKLVEASKKEREEAEAATKKRKTSRKKS